MAIDHNVVYVADMNRLACLLAFAATLGIASLIDAATWTSADKNVSFDLPDDGSYVVVPNPAPPSEAMWHSKDGQTRLIFIATDNPENIAPEKAGLEQGTVTTVKGLLISSTQRLIGTVPTYTIAAKGSMNGANIYVSQVILSFAKKNYKLLAGSAADVSRDPQLAAIFATIKVLDPAPLLPGPPPAVPLTGREAAANRLSVRVSEGAVWVLLAAGIVALIRRRTAKQKLPTSPPPLP